MGLLDRLRKKGQKGHGGMVMGVVVPPPPRHPPKDPLSRALATQILLEIINDYPEVPLAALLPHIRRTFHIAQVGSSPMHRYEILLDAPSEALPDAIFLDIIERLQRDTYPSREQAACCSDPEGTND